MGNTLLDKGIVLKSGETSKITVSILPTGTIKAKPSCGGLHGLIMLTAV